MDSQSPAPRSKPVLGLIGGIGSGKSFVAAELVRHGGAIVSGDQAGHEALRQPDIKAHVVERWGPGVLNDSGEIDLTLPSNSNFQVAASSRSGEVQSDFEDASLKLANESDTGRLNGNVGSHGPRITLTTSYGTIYLRKSS